MGEKAVSAGALAVVGAVLVGMAVQQARFSPAVRMAGSAPREAPAGRRDLLAPWPAALSPMGAPEEFPAATLSDKIDGKAELYLSAGFVRLASQRVRIGGEGGSWIEMSVYDMGGPVNAFSVWSSQKRPEAPEAGLADYSYRAGNEVCLVHGKFYVEFVGTDAQEPTLRAAEALTRAFVAQTAVAEHANTSAEQALFPPDGLIPGSVALVPTDVFGSDRLKAVFVARYRDGAQEVTLFTARRAAPADAARDAAELHAFWVQDCGGRDAVPAPAGAAIVDLGGSFEAVLVSGRFLAGVHQADSRAAADRWLGLLRRRLGEGKP